MRGPAARVPRVVRLRGYPVLTAREGLSEMGAKMSLHTRMWALAEIAGLNISLSVCGLFVRPTSSQRVLTR